MRIASSRGQFRTNRFMTIACHKTPGVVSRSPAHPVHGDAGDRVLVVAVINKAVLGVEGDGAGIVLVDQQSKSRGRAPFRFVEQSTGKTRAPMLRRDDDLVEILRV